MHQPTEEQQACINLDVEKLVVRAFAGTGKTSMLAGFARRRPDARMLYIVLNKPVQIEAQQRFKGTLVKPMTSHGLAFKYFGKLYHHKLVPNLKPYEVSAALGLESALGGAFSRNEALVLAWLVLETLNRFLHSPDMEILPRHAAPDFRRLPAAVQDGNLSDDDMREILAEGARQLWDLMRDTADSRVGMLHDGYLKLFQMSSPRLEEDYVLLDEAQDANPCTLDILLRQASPKVLVGDSHQGIYGWRGARNALNLALRQGGTGRHLTGSFRFGDAIAQVANAILSLKGETVPVRGLGGPDRIGTIPPGQPRAIISRSNAGVFASAAQALVKKKRYWFVGGVAGYRFDIIEDAHRLSRQRHGEIRDPFIRSFPSFAELKEYAEEVGDCEIRTRCRIVDQYGDAIPSILEKLKNNAGGACSPESAQAILSTGHKSKGLEFDNVQLGEDFVELCEIPKLDGLLLEEKRAVIAPMVEDINVLYVAATRARRMLQLNRDLELFLSRAGQRRQNSG
jgi:superfamily I DNA/RNA helicase